MQELGLRTHATHNPIIVTMVMPRQIQTAGDILIPWFGRGGWEGDGGAIFQARDGIGTRGGVDSDILLMFFYLVRREVDQVFLGKRFMVL